jgi:hypothetical protein
MNKVFCVEYMGGRKYFKTWGENMMTHIKSIFGGMDSAAMIISVVDCFDSAYDNIPI